MRHLQKIPLQLASSAAETKNVISNKPVTSIFTVPYQCTYAYALKTQSHAGFRIVGKVTQCFKDDVKII